MSLAFGISVGWSQSTGIAPTRVVRIKQRTTPARLGRSRVQWRGCAAVENSDPASMSRSEFDKRMEDRTLMLAFIGMSNCGKSYRSQQLCFTKGFVKYCMDDEIELELSSVLSAAGVDSGIDGVAKWMGFPYQDGFDEKEKTYLAIEEVRTKFATGGEHRGNIALDTTGSVVYLSDDVLNGLREKYLVVNFATDSSMLTEMREDFFNLPKPVSWGGTFNQNAGEDDEQALRRCYPTLLETRQKKYAELSHVSVPATVTRDVTVSVEDFLAEIRSALPES